MIRLAHLSDIHVTAPRLDWSWRDWLDKRLTSWINYRWLGRRFRFRRAEDVVAALVAGLRGRGIDHVVFSGDATALGFESEFRRAAEALGVSGEGGLPGLAVPGNHDYCTVACATAGLFERHFGPWQQGERVDGATYPFAQRVGPVWLVGVNSSTGNRWAWDASGEVGAAQLARLEQLLGRLPPGPRILVTHYPVALASGQRERRTHGLRDLARVLPVAVRGGVCLWLHGHRHGPYHHAASAFAPFAVVCAGSATQSGLWSYNEYTIDGPRLQGVRRVFDDQEGCFRDGFTFELDLSQAGESGLAVPALQAEQSDGPAGPPQQP